MQYQAVAQTHKVSSAAAGVPLIRIIYSSVLVTTDRAEAERQIQDIVNVAIAHNTARSIGGMLYVNQATFDLAQVLEGPSADVKELFKRIESDKRHRDVCLVDSTEITQRRFQEWGMLRGTVEDYKVLRETYPTIMEWNVHDSSSSLENLDMLPLAGDFDLELLRIAYTSTLVAEESSKVMQGIIEHANLNNQKQLIGGVLYFNQSKSRVVQCLEGPDNAVRTLYEKICQDKRHRDVRLVINEPLDKRSFKSFGMIWVSDTKDEDMVLLPGTVQQKLQTLQT